MLDIDSITACLTPGPNAAPETEYKCSKCKKLLPESDFSSRRNKRQNRPVQWYCKKCAAASDKARSHETIRRYGLKTNYGITPEHYNETLVKQEGGCAICRSATTGSKRSSHFHVDHDHTTGKVRGLLCHQCNIGLGGFRDNIQSMKNAITYLEKHK